MSRNWIATLNNPTPQDDLLMNFENRVIWGDRVSFAVWMRETGENGTPHYQIYLETETPVRLTWLRRRLPRAHFEKRRGSRQEAIAYSLKTCNGENDNGSARDFLRLDATTMLETISSASDRINIFPRSTTWQDVVEILTTTQKKSKLQLIQERLNAGCSEVEIANEDFASWVRHYRAFREYRLLTTPARTHETEVYVLQGPTGTGKSRHCQDGFPGAYWKQRSQWWDGYVGQEVVILDEFYGWLPYDTLLRLCDRYPLLVETKGGQVNFVAKKIIITTNAIPCNWYRNVYFPAFVRRVTKWMVFPQWGEPDTYYEYDVASRNFILPQ